MAIEERVKVVEVVALETDPPVTLDAETSVREVVRQMCEQKSGCALLTTDDRLVGIFTERDVLLKTVGSEEAMDQPVSQWMTPDPVTVTENDPIQKALSLMCEGGFRNVPVTDDNGRIVSYIRHKDIVHYLVVHFAQHVLNLPSDPEQMCESQEGA